MNINKWKYFLFFIVVLLLISISYSADVNLNNSTDIKDNISSTHTADIEKTTDIKTNTTSKQIDKKNTTNNVKSTTQSKSKTKVIYVNPNSDVDTQDGSSKNPYITIELAVKNTLKGYENTIYLSEGNHILNKSITLTNNISFIGQGRYLTNITCQKNQGFRIQKNVKLIFKKIRMQNASYSQGGAMQFAENSQFNIDTCIFTKNTANNGAVIFTTGNNIKGSITNTIINLNTNVRFGALQLGGFNSVYNLNKCTFTSNVVTDKDYSHSTGGAAIYSSSFATVNINNSIFKKNKSIWGNAILNGNHATTKITNSLFSDNIAIKNQNSSTNRTRGGAVAIGSGYLEIGFCNFTSNKADIGGAISINSGEDSLIYSCMFQNNVAYFEAGAINNYGNLKLLNSTFIKNSADRRGGALIDKGINTVSIDSCTFKNNKVLTTKIQNKFLLIPQGGAISIIGACPKFVIKNSIFDHNSAYYGGAIYSNEDLNELTIRNTTFHNNTACYGASIVAAGETILNVYNDSFTFNRAIREGGAILINATVRGNFENTIFKNNSVSDLRYGDGGVIFINTYSKLVFNACLFDGNHANIKGGVICANSVVNLHFIASNITNNKATTGSVIYINNSKNYKSFKTQIILDTSTILNNIGQYVFYSTKKYDEKYNYVLIRTCWFGSNYIPGNVTNNFKLLNNAVLTISLNEENIVTNWRKSQITLTVNRTCVQDKDLILNINNVWEATAYKYTDAFLPTKTFSIQENNNKAVKKQLYSYYHLNLALNKIIIKLDKEKIIINIVD